MSISTTPFANSDTSNNIFNHLNEHHADDLLTLALFDNLNGDNPTPISAKLIHIYQEGLELLIKNENSEYTKFIAFDSPLTNIDEFYKPYLLLLKQAGKATNRRYVDDTVDKITVLKNETLGNFIRITVELPNDVPTDKAGFAFLLQINDNEARYYTLRKAWRENEKIIGQIDIFTHSSDGTDTLGSAWAKALKAGDVLTSTRRYPEKTEHLMDNVLLIGDETSLPTVLRILELNQFNHPMIIACLNNKSDEIYLKDCEYPYHLIIYNKPIELIDKITDFIKNKQISSVWAAMECEVIKALRKNLKENLGLSKNEMAVKVYWRLT